MIPQKRSISQVVIEGRSPAVADGFVPLAIPFELDREVGEAVVIVQIASLIPLEKFDKDFFVIPGERADIGLPLPPLKFGKIGLTSEPWFVTIIRFDQRNDCFGAPFEPFDVEIDLGTHHVLGRPVEGRAIGINVVSRTSMATGNDHFLLRFFLNVVEQLDESWIDKFFPLFEWEAVLKHSSAIKDISRPVTGRFGLRVVARTPPTAEKLLVDADLIANVGVFPRIIFSRLALWSRDGKERFIVSPVDILSGRIHFPNPLFLRILESRASD